MNPGPPMSDSPPPGPAGEHRFRTSDAFVVGAIVAAGGLWFVGAGYGVEWWLPFEAAILLVVALAVIFGATLSIGRGIVATAALAAVLISGSFLARLAFESRGAMTREAVMTTMGAIYWFAGMTLIVLSLAWLSGVVIGSVWRWARRRRST